MSSLQERAGADPVAATPPSHRCTESEQHVARCGAWLVAGLATGLVVVLAASVYAQVTVRHSRVSRAVENALSGATPVGGLAEMLLVLPLAALGLFAATLHRRWGPTAGALAMGVGVVAVQLLYARSFTRIECLLRQRQWTMASLETAALVVVAPVAVGIIAVATALIGGALRWATKGPDRTSMS